MSIAIRAFILDHLLLGVLLLYLHLGDYKTFGLPKALPLLVSPGENSSGDTLYQRGSNQTKLPKPFFTQFNYLTGVQPHHLAHLWVGLQLGFPWVPGTPIGWFWATGEPSPWFRRVLPGFQG